MAREWTEGDGRERKFTVSVSRPSECKRVLSIQIPREELEHEKATVLAELRRDLKVPGFRKGKVPAKYIEKHYAQVIHGDAVRNLLPNVYEHALAQEKIAPVGEPRFDNVHTDGDADITFDVTVEVRPDVKVDGYSGIKVKVARLAVDEKRVDEALEQLRERLTTLKVVDREVRQGDVVIVDYGPLLDDGEVDAKAMARNYPVDLSGETLLREFKEGLVGMETGDTKNLRVKYPDDFPEKEMAGTERVFQVTVKELKEREVPELDDAFARRVGEQFADLAALRAQIKEDLVKDEEKRYLHEVEENIIDQLIDKNKFEVPEAMIHNYLSSVLEEDRKRRPRVADEAEREREVREHFHDAAVRTIKKYFILEAVKKQEHLELGGDEVEARIKELAENSQASADEVRQYFAHPERRRNLENELLDQKVLNFLRDGADIKVA